ncbi:MAG: cadmium-translocating P-type ATPase [Clostridium sp.]|nr:cadmium-translocating P-type ATPase [Clostridium sp.]
MTKKEKRNLIRIIISGLLFALSFIFKTKYVVFGILLVSYIIIGYDVLLKAFRNIKRGKIFDENFLMSVATIGAICISDMREAVAVMLFYQIGELFQSYAVNKSRKSIIELMDIRSDYANVIRNGKNEKVDPNEVNIEEIILVKPGEKIPLDGVIVEGKSLLNTVALTGESVPRSVKENDEVLSGCINNEGILKIKVTKKFGDSTVSKILDLVENASNRKSKSEAFITKFAKYYTPIVCGIALVVAIFPPLILKEPFNTWIYKALSFLVVSCPCALVISIPLSFFGGLGASSNIGVLVKGSNYLEALSNVDIVVCDKTGTLTEGVFKVQEINAVGISNEELLKMTAYAESFSNHPISISLKEAYGKKIDSSKVTKAREIVGKGIYAKVLGKDVYVGNDKLLKELEIKIDKVNKTGTVIYTVIDNKYCGYILISDKIKEDSYKMIKSLKKNNISKIVMLTGDRENISKSISNELKLDEYYAELLPQDKVSITEKIMHEKDGNLLFIGDGINDAPVLALSDIGVSMGSLGSDAAIEASDIVIMTDEPSKISDVIKISKKTMKIVHENIVFAISIKIAVLILSLLGIATMWSAVFADVGVSVIAILNSLRILNVKKYK